MGLASYLEYPKVSDKPIRAPENFRELPMYKDVKNCTYVGSGVPLRNHPLYKDGKWLFIYDWHFECARCGSENTLCIYITYLVDISGKLHDIELYCQDYGAFTLHSYGD